MQDSELCEPYVQLKKLLWKLTESIFKKNHFNLPYSFGFSHKSVKIFGRGENYTLLNKLNDAIRSGKD